MMLDCLKSNNSHISTYDLSN